MHPFNIIASVFAFVGVQMVLKGDGVATFGALAISATILIAGILTGGRK